MASAFSIATYISVLIYSFFDVWMLRFCTAEIVSWQLILWKNEASASCPIGTFSLRGWFIFHIQMVGLNYYLTGGYTLPVETGEKIIVQKQFVQNVML